MENQKTTTQEANGTFERIVTVITTVGEKKKIPFTGTSWAELRQIVQENGYNLNNIKAVEGTTKHTLEHDAAILPDGDFKLFLMPYQSKSGGLSRTELYDQIKAAIEKDGEKAKEYFNEGQNYTRKTSSDLSDLLEKYKPGTKKAAKKAKVTAVTDTVNNAVDATTGTDSEAASDTLGDILKLPLEDKVNFLVTLALSLKKDVAEIKNAGVRNIVDSLSTKVAGAELVEDLPEPKETEEERIAREQKEEADRLAKEEAERLEAEAKAKEEADKAETDELLDEMDGLMGGFKDVKKGISRRR